MEELNKQQEEQVQGTETQENEELKIDNVAPTMSEGTEGTLHTTGNQAFAKSFKEMLDDKEIEVGTKISFIPKDGKEVTITVDEAFLKLPIKDEEYYKEFNYKLVD